MVESLDAPVMGVRKAGISLSSFCAPHLCEAVTVSTDKKKVNFERAEMSFSAGDSLAVVAVHFGTTHEDTRERSIEAINQKVMSHYPNACFAEAYTSRIIINRLKERGIIKHTPAEVFNRLKAEGYTHLLVQSTHIIDGVEMESLRHEVDAMKGSFKQIRLGRPLLYTPEDYNAAIDALTSHVPSKSDAIVLVGHGTYTPITASYAMMDYMLKAKGFDNWCVGTIENYPSLDEVFAFLQARGARTVTLAPFMFVAGEHAKEDIAGEWKESLEEAGYEVDVFMQGMGENPAIQGIFMQHMHFAATHRYLDIMSKKRMYAMAAPNA